MSNLDEILRNVWRDGAGLEGSEILPTTKAKQQIKELVLELIDKEYQDADLMNDQPATGYLYELRQKVKKL